MKDTPTPSSASVSDSEALAKFYRMVPSASQPVPADAAAGGTLPLRAYRYCEPIRVASQLGWYVFPPMDFSLIWDGTQIFWTYADAPDWMPLDAVQFPKFAGQFDASAPDDIKGYSPPFMASVLQPGVLQVWSGLIARTAPDWCLLVREPANLPRNQHFQGFEGVIETDRWFGPLFTNIRLTKTDTRVDIKKDHPFFTIQPIHRNMLDPKLSGRVEKVAGMSEMTDSDWQDYRDTIVNRVGDKRVAGDYAKTSRKRRKRDDSAP
ncbi:DUF6065 family protein [Nereida sp. MMG025]|uniref:DUF6065 family protein n=1 Tax=Nereida sp. MMG025 TaxID=2909981 RepID=UPI001F35C43C|nr:DUF6065 family protein [Nereida sp. MMG025]MCF6444145.1 DUF6065 family protein [Nereida sp. MMG025]